ncbi:hypothetical protein [Kluyvera sp. CHPC 1.251]|uniref:hypothetical protein n=1 Tax=Kluyvera sp. CHPC 1.251 TaxID=2995175 RepID=UPI002FD87858
MKNILAAAHIRTQTYIILFLCALLVIGTFWYVHPFDESDPDNFVCRASIQIVREDVVFRGILDLKTGNGKGVANINGIITDEKHVENTVQRTILFKHSDFGPSRIWVSHQILISNRETAPAELVQKVLPDFYLKPTSISNVDMYSLSKGTRLITKEDIPYLYCNDYVLPGDE